MQLSQEMISQSLQIRPQSRKSFVFDLDGTLIYKGQPLEKKFEQVLLDIKDAGHQIIFATGRSWRDFVPVVPAWCSAQDSVVFGGGLVLAGGDIRHQQFMPTDDLAAIIAILENEQVSYLLDGHRSYYHPGHEHWLFADILKISGQPRATSVDNVVADGAYKIMVLNDEWLSHFQEFSRERQLAIKHHFYDKCFDVMPAAVNKLSGLNHLTLPDPADVYVFGNDHNDLELMQEFGNSIMFGHHHELLKHAKLQIEYNDDLFDNFTRIVNTILKKC